MVESNCNIMNVLIFAEYYLMTEGLPDHVARKECLRNASILLVGYGRRGEGGGEFIGEPEYKSGMVTFEII